MARWLEENDTTPQREAQFRQQTRLMCEALGYPADTPECRRFLLDMASDRGAPPVRSVGIGCGIESWRCFLCSECGIEALRTAAEALRGR